MKSILTSDLRILGRITDASNATLLAEINGTKYVYKPIAGERPLWDFPTGNLAYREYGAYLVSEALGLNLVPTTILRDGVYGEGMVQEWCEPNPDIDVIEIAQSENPEIRKMTIFDVIINNGDRKFGHILPKTEKKILGCDHGVTFNVENKLRTVLWQWRGTSYTENELSIFKEAIEFSRSGSLEQYITEAEIEAMIHRCQLQIDIGFFPQPSEEWPAIPWPPF
jgi:uncharacterized repeat protein (TIGR03843 family)